MFRAIRKSTWGSAHWTVHIVSGQFLNYSTRSKYVSPYSSKALLNFFGGGLRYFSECDIALSDQYSKLFRSASTSSASVMFVAVPPSLPK